MSQSQSHSVSGARVRLVLFLFYLGIICLSQSSEAQTLKPKTTTSDRRQASVIGMIDDQLNFEKESLMSLQAMSDRPLTRPVDELVRYPLTLMWHTGSMTEQEFQVFMTNTPEPTMQFVP